MSTELFATSGAKFLRASDIARKKKNQTKLTVLPITYPTLWRWVQEGKFPKPVKLSSGVTAWRVVDINDWLAAQQLS